jgi:tRNA pseudouridine38-40 synthase
MPRYRLTLEYDGAPFVGWQRQQNGPSVQEALEGAVFAFCGETATAIAAGRTDAGVHAAGQVVHFDLARSVETDTLRDALNAHLRPQPIAVLDAERAPDDFHARFSAVARHYRYCILNRRAPPALLRGRAWHVPRPLDAEAMNDAAQALVGRHDFTTFRSAECQARTAEKTLDRLSVAREGACVVIEASARSFLHHQVRSMVGTLKLVGLGTWTRRDLEQALAARDRTACGPVAPPEGLTLMRVDYPALSSPGFP